MRIALFILMVIESLCALALSAFVWTVCESPIRDQADINWRFWAWCMVLSTTAGAIASITCLFAHSRWPRWPRWTALTLHGTSVVLAVMLGFSSVGLVVAANVNSKGGEDWGAMGVLVVAGVSIVAAILVGVLSLIVMIPLAAVGAKFEAKEVDR